MNGGGGRAGYARVLALAIVLAASVTTLRAQPAPTPVCPFPSPSGAATPSVSNLPSILSRPQFEALFPNHNKVFTYDGLIAAAESFPGFASVGSTDVEKQELAAFFANVSQETTGSWPQPEPSVYQWGLYFADENANCEPGAQGVPPAVIAWCGSFCAPYSAVSPYQCDAANPPFYQGRGPIQLTYSYNYGPAEACLNLDIYNAPQQIVTDPAIAWKTGLWFWMTPQPPKPSAHDVMVGNWQPSPQDIALGRAPGFGMTINVINGGLECGPNLPLLNIDGISMSGNTVTITTGAAIPSDYVPAPGVASYVQISGVTPAGYNGISQIQSVSGSTITVTNENFSGLPPGGGGTFTLSRPPVAVKKKNNRIANYVKYFTSAQWGLSVAPGPNVDCERMSSY